MPHTTLESPMNERTPYYRYDDLASRYNVNRITIWRWVKAGQFPPPIRVSRKDQYWDEAMIREWESRQETKWTIRRPS